MGTSLNGLTPANTYKGLIKTTDNTEVDATLKALSDGDGNDLPLLVSTQSVTNYGGGAITSNTAFGAEALKANTTGINNTAVGNLSLSESTTASNNTVMGSNALQTTTTASQNNAFGTSALRNNTTGGRNSAFGVNALLLCSIGSSNAAFGNSALQNNTASNNTAVGFESGYNVTTGQNNTLLGKDAGKGITTGSGNTIIGPATGLDSALTNHIVLADGAGNQRINVNAIGQVGIGTPAPSARLHIKGSGSTSATTALLVQNSAGTELLKVNDAGDLFFNGLETSPMRIHTLGNTNKGITIDNEMDMGAFFGITFKTWDGSAYSDFMRINGNTASRGLIIGGTSNNASAKLQVDSTTQGLLPPRMTTTQKNAISSPAAGLQVYDTTLNQMSYYNGSSWINF